MNRNKEESESSIDKLLGYSPYHLSSEQKDPLLLQALQESYQHHFENCSGYRRFCERQNLTFDSQFKKLEDFPFLPVQAFKEAAQVLRSVDVENVHLKLESSATSGRPSQIFIDKITSKRQVRALASVISEVLGPKRRPFVVVDADPSEAKNVLGARAAAVRGFLNLAREVQYVMSYQSDGSLKLLEESLSNVLLNYTSRKTEPVVVFGFTYVLYLYGILPLHKSGKKFSLPEGSFVIHIGGWKKLEDQKVSREEFNTVVSEVFQLPKTSVIDFYGFTEQMGVTYPDSPDGVKHVPVFADVMVRDPVTFSPLPDGKIGILQFLSPVPHSYPGLSILTDDLGVIVGRGRAGNGWHGTQFKVLGRAKNAEARGCGDIMGDKIEAARARSSKTELQKSHLGARLLFDAAALHVTNDLFLKVDLEKLPLVTDLSALSARLLEGRKILDTYSVDELITLISEASKRWILPNSSLLPLKQEGLLFLTNWCKSTLLRSSLDRSLRGARGYLDGFRNSMNERRAIMAQPRGLIAHWLAGNVPLLGMLVLVQGILSRNANILKSASSFSSVLPILLESFRNLEVPLKSGRVLFGNDILKSIAVIYFSREDEVAAAALSQSAQIRLAWGGKEAVEAIMNLPKRYGTEDIIFGPKLSYMAIGKEFLSTERQVKKMSRAAATDSSVFDQYACASPHTIFVERGGLAASPKDFAAHLAHEMEKAALRIPKQPPDAGTVGVINQARMKYAFTEEMWSSTGSEWTVLYDDKSSEGLSKPTYSRVITVKAIDNILGAAEFAHSETQTIGLALEGRRRLQFAERASLLGAERFPDVGRMTFFDSPWDGLFPIDRMVRWVSLGGPV